MITANDFVPATPEAICRVCGRASGYIITRDNRHTCYLRCVHAVGVGEHGGVPCVIFNKEKNIAAKKETCYPDGKRGSDRSSVTPHS